MPPRKSLILVVEDDLDLLRLARRTLEYEGYRVITAEDGLTALKLAANPEVDVIVLDLRLPGMDGRTVCRRIREFSDVYIIMATAERQQEEIISGLDAGADDYITKPFDVAQLTARVRAVLRRRRNGETTRVQPTYAHDGLVVDFTAQQVTRGDALVRLTRTEFKLLAELAAYPGQVLTYHQLLERVWGPEYTDDRHLLQSTVNRLRKKIEPDVDQPRYLLNRPGVGYLVPKPA